MEDPKLLSEQWSNISNNLLRSLCIGTPDFSEVENTPKLEIFIPNPPQRFLELRDDFKFKMSTLFNVYSLIMFLRVFAFQYLDLL